MQVGPRPQKWAGVRSAFDHDGHLPAITSRPLMTRSAREQWPDAPARPPICPAGSSATLTAWSPPSSSSTTPARCSCWLDGRRGAAPHADHRAGDLLEPQPAGDWVKGETSGHRQWVREVRLDCDGDAVLVKVDQEGPACHTGDRTCFDDGLLPSQPRSPRDQPRRRRRPRGRSAMLAKDRRVIPVTRRLLADGETPVGVYRSWPGAGRAPSCWSRPSTAGSGRATRSSAPGAGRR